MNLQTLCNRWYNCFWYAINNFMMGKYSRFLFIFFFLNKRMCEYYHQHCLENLSEETCSFNRPCLYVYNLLLVISLYFCFSPNTINMLFTILMLLWILLEWLFLPINISNYILDSTNDLFSQNYLNWLLFCMRKSLTQSHNLWHLRS